MKKYILLGSFALILISFLSNCAKNSSVVTGDSTNSTNLTIVVEEDVVNLPDQPNAGGGRRLRKFECGSPGDCMDPGSGPCPCATCYDASGNCLGWVTVEYKTVGSNVSGLDDAIASGTVQTFWRSNSDLWQEFFPEAPPIVLNDLQDGLITMKMYSVRGDHEHIYVVVLPDGSPANY